MSEAVQQEEVNWQVKHDKAVAGQQRVQQAIEQAKGEIVGLERQLKQGERLQAEMDAREALGEASNSKKAVDLAAISAEIQRKRNLIATLRQRGLEYETAALETQEELWGQERNANRGNIHAAVEDVKTL
jgi:hypothetical protein